MYCIVLYCIVLYRIVLYCIVLYCIVLYCIVLYCIVLYCNVLYCIVLYCIVLFCFVLFFFVLYCTVLYCIVLYCIVLYCTVLYCILFVLYCIQLFFFSSFTSDLDLAHDTVAVSECFVKRQHMFFLRLKQFSSLQSLDFNKKSRNRRFGSFPNERYTNITIRMTSDNALQPIKRQILASLCAGFVCVDVVYMVYEEREEK